MILLEIVYYVMMYLTVGLVLALLYEIYSLRELEKFQKKGLINADQKVEIYRGLMFMSNMLNFLWPIAIVFWIVLRIKDKFL